MAAIMAIYSRPYGDLKKSLGASKFYNGFWLITSLIYVKTCRMYISLERGRETLSTDTNFNPFCALMEMSYTV